MAWTYILLCSDGALYVGSTRNLDNRMFQHSQGACDAFTKSRQPVTLVFAGEFSQIGEAYAFERQIKGWSRAKKWALIESRFDDLPALSRKKWGPSNSLDLVARPRGEKN